ncbi:MAG: hypothetical protein ABFR33_03160 [Verrucomicrobiota bacterium]
MMRLILLGCFLCVASSGFAGAVVPMQPEPEERMPGVSHLFGSGYETPDAPQVTMNMLAGAGPVSYRAQLDQGGDAVVVFAFYEHNYGQPGHRVVDLNVEGADREIVDVVERAGWRKAVAVAVEGRDADGDGWLNLEVAPHAGAEDPAVTVGGVWVFDQAVWAKGGFDVNEVLFGKHDDQTMYRVDCGLEASFYSTLSARKRMLEVNRSMIGLLEIPGRHAELEPLFDAPILELVGEYRALEKSHEAGAVNALYTSMENFNVHYAALKGAISAKLLEGKNPAYTQPAQTHLANPWGSIVRVRQEDSLSVEIEVMPKPLSGDHKYHSFGGTARKPWGWLEFKSDAMDRLDSTSLGFDYDFGLTAIQYDPIVTRYRYNAGDIQVRMMDVAAIRVGSEEFNLSLSLDTDRVENRNGFYYAATDPVLGARVFSTIVPRGLDAAECAEGFERGEFAGCGGYTVCWADSLEELKQLAAEMGNWNASMLAAKQWELEGQQALLAKSTPIREKRLETDKRTLRAMFQKFGGISAALDGYYESIWNRDTSIVATCAALSGQPGYLDPWANYMLSNPSPEVVDGKEYGIFIIAPYTGHESLKKEDDGLFYAVLSAYAHWKMLGDDSQLEAWYPTLTNALEWVRKVSYKEELKLYAESLINEAPLQDSESWEHEKQPGLLVNGEWPMRFLGLYINNLMYGAHLMLAEMADHLGLDAEVESQMAMATSVADAVNTTLWNEERGVYHCGIAVMKNGDRIYRDWTYWDSYFDYIWAVSLFPIQPHMGRSAHSLDTLLHDGGNFPYYAHMSCGLGHAAITYSWAGEFEKAAECCDFLVNFSESEEFNPTMQAVYAMKGSVPEWTFTVKQHRPQTFAMAPLMNGMVAQAVALDYNGATVMQDGYLQELKGVKFKNSILNVDLTGWENAAGLVIDGEACPHTMRIPNSFLGEGEHEVGILTGESDGPLLLWSNLELLDVVGKPGGVEYTLNGYGNGVLRFKELDPGRLAVQGVDKSALEFWSTPQGDCVQVPMAGNVVKLMVRK